MYNLIVDIFTLFLRLVFELFKILYMQGFCSSIPYQHDSHVEYCTMYMLYFMFVSVGISILHLFSCQYVCILQTSLMMSQTCYNVYTLGNFFSPVQNVNC